MPERDDYAAVLDAHLPLIDRTVAALCRRHGVGRDETWKVGAWVKWRIELDDHAMLRQFRDWGSLETYLTMLVTVLYHEYRVARRRRAR